MSLLRADAAERALMAGILVWPDKGADSWRVLEQEGLTPDDFGLAAMAELARGVSRVVARGDNLDAVGAFESMTSSGREMIGGLVGLSKLEGEATAAHVRTHAAIVVRAAQRRRVHRWHLERAQELETNEELSEPEPWREHLANTKAEAGNFDSIGQGTGAVVPALEVLRPLFREMSESAAGIKRGVSTGFPSLDSKWTGGGLCGGWLVVLMGRPKMGKTSFALSLTREALFTRIPHHAWRWKNKENATPVLWACDEMRNQDVLARLIADVGDLDGRAVGAPSKGWMERHGGTVAMAGDLMHQSPLAFVKENDCGRLERIFAAARTWRAKQVADQHGKKGPAIVVIDYLQRMTMAGLGPRASKEERVNEMAKACKSLARELDCVVLLLAQLNRDLERREDKRPRSSDARDSGGIEQEADTLLGCYRPVVYDSNAEHLRQQATRLRGRGGGQELIDVERRLTEAEIIICDNRHGPKGTANVEFRGERFRFAPRPMEE